MPDPSQAGPGAFFQLFTEIGILNQLSSAMLEARLPPGLLASHFGVIMHLSRAGDGATPVALARSFQVAKTTMTHTLSGLEKHRLIEMRPNPRDKRSKQVWLTDAGHAFLGQASEALRPDIKAMLEDFNPQDALDLAERLRPLREWMDARRDM